MECVLWRGHLLEGLIPQLIIVFCCKGENRRRGGGGGKRGNRNGVKRGENNEEGEGKGSNQSYRLSNLGLVCVVITHLHITHTTCTQHIYYST